MIQFDYKSTELFLHNKSYELSSLMGEDNFYFGLFELPERKLKQAKLISDLPDRYYLEPEKIRSILVDEQLVSEKISRASFLYQSPYFAIYPDFIADTMSDQEIAKEISALNYDIRYKLIRHGLQENESSFCFLGASQIDQTLKEIYPEYSITHLNARFFELLRSMDTRFLFMHVFGNSMQIMMVDEGKLLQTNDFSYSSADDLLYYVLLTLKNHDFDPANTRVYVSGIIEAAGTAMELLGRHIRYITLKDNRAVMSYSNIFLGKQKSYFFSLECSSYADHQR